jgi:hypothetical protein
MVILNTNRLKCNFFTGGIESTVPFVSCLGQYLPDTTRTTKSSPAYSMGFRPPDLSTERAPGPADYYPDEKREPKITIKGRLPDPNKDNLPGPGAYAPEVSGPSAYKGAPKYSFGLKAGMHIAFAGRRERSI